MKRICVIGSINIDLTAKMDRFPLPGEAIVCKSFGEYGGGKGANQAIGLGKLGSDVHLIGKVGKDLYGEKLVKNLKDYEVKTEYVFKDSIALTGVSLIFINNGGENCIAHYPGANDMLNFKDIKKTSELLGSSDIILLQLEIPLEIVFYIIKKYYKLGKIIILDPAPYSKLPIDIFPYISILTPNRIEMEQLTNIKINSENDSYKAAKILMGKGANIIINKIDSSGSFLVDRNDFTFIPSFKVKTVDTTGAGDAFNSGLAYALSKGEELAKSVKFANLIGALSVTKQGAQSSMPTIIEVIEYVKKENLSNLFSLISNQ